jgi:hypothetical protein
MARATGFEPVPFRLTAESSTVKLDPNISTKTERPLRLSFEWPSGKEDAMKVNSYPERARTTRILMRFRFSRLDIKLIGTNLQQQFGKCKKFLSGNYFQVGF